MQTNTYQFADGRSVTQNFFGVVAGKGAIKIESSEPPFCNYTTLAEEYGDLIIFQIWDRATGVLLGVETINLSDDNTCVRIAKDLLKENLGGGMTIVEHRIGRSKHQLNSFISSDRKELATNWFAMKTVS